MYSLFNVAIYQCQTTDWNKNILKFFTIQEKVYFCKTIQEKVYFCKRNNLEYVKCQCKNKDECVNYEKKDIR